MKLYINDLRHGGRIVLLCISPFYDKYQSIVADPKHYDAEDRDPDPSLHFDADLDSDPASQNVTDPCGSGYGTATML